jgi:serine/threonine-protein kinase
MTEELLDGRYELRDLIGSGGMARVYRAFDRTLKREVAVKMLIGDTVDEAASVERFRREARAAANLSHPNIVGIYDWGETNGAHSHSSYFMVMELVPGENLKEIIDGRGHLPEGEALDIAAQVAAALQAAHDHGVVHRDVKPQNILIGSSGQVKMTDFGIARAAGLTQLTATDAICGTPYYLSPEQALRQPLDSRSDVYGLGVVLYEMLTGTELFHGSPLEVAMRHVEEEAPTPRALRPEISAATETIVRRALAKKPDHRFQSAGEMRTALRQARNRLALADPLPASPPAGSASRRSRAPGTAGLTTQWRLRQPQAQPYLRKDGSPANPWWRVLPVLLLVAAFTGALAYLNARNSTSGHGSKPAAAGQLHTPVPTAPPSPAATHAAAATALPTATAAVTATAAPAATAPTNSVAVLAPAGSPYDPVKSFYQLVSDHQFRAAAALWTPRLQRQDPPSEYIDRRFRDTSSIVITRYNYAIDKPAGTAAVAVQLLETDNSGAQTIWNGSWKLVLGGSGWLLDQPAFGPPNQLGPAQPASESGPPVHGNKGKHHGNGDGNDGSGD